MSQNALRIDSYSATVYKRCSCCSRVRDLYYRMDVKDAKTATLVVGAFELCRDCGGNLGEILGQEVSSDISLSEFSFGDD